MTKLDNHARRILSAMLQDDPALARVSIEQLDPDELHSLAVAARRIQRLCLVYRTRRPSCPRKVS